MDQKTTLVSALAIFLGLCGYSTVSYQNYNTRDNDLTPFAEYILPVHGMDVPSDQGQNA